MKNRKKRNIFLLIILVLCISVGFAMLSTTLKINGDTIVKKNVWSIYWDNVGDIKKTNSVVVNTQASVDINNNTLVNFSVTLDKPGDFYEFQVDAVNAGTIDAMVDTISTIINDDEEEELPSYIKYSVTYADNVKVNKYDLLEKADYSTDPITPTTERYKIRIEFSRDVTNEEYAAIPANGLSYTFDISIPYIQSDEHAKYKPGIFEVGTWDEIITAYHNGDPEPSLQKSLKRGSTREIELDMDHDGTSDTTGHLRIANLSTPSECENSNFSQTACGFVVEFADIIGTHRMNFYPDGSWFSAVGVGSRGGWEHSDIRAYLNGGTYNYENINYEDSSLLLSLPSDLRSKIIDTKVSSSDYSLSGSSTSFVTDKIYYLSPTELWGQYSGNSLLNYNLNKTKTRQLDYYNVMMSQENIYLPNSNYPDEIGYKATMKKSAGDFEWPVDKYPDYWGLREVYAYNNWDSSFYRVLYTGALSCTQSHYMHGISPAFRIAKVES